MTILIWINSHLSRSLISLFFFLVSFIKGISIRAGSLDAFGCWQHIAWILFGDRWRQGVLQTHISTWRNIYSTVIGEMQALCLQYVLSLLYFPGWQGRQMLPFIIQWLVQVWEQRNRRSSFCSPCCAGFAEPWAEAAGLPSALPVLKLLSIQLF